MLNTINHKLQVLIVSLKYVADQMKVFLYIKFIVPFGHSGKMHVISTLIGQLLLRERSIDFCKMMLPLNLTVLPRPVRTIQTTKRIWKTPLLGAKHLCNNVINTRIAHCFPYPGLLRHYTCLDPFGADIIRVSAQSKGFRQICEKQYADFEIDSKGLQAPKSIGELWGL